jgi:uncharacterized protein (TIGR03067 family)
VSGGALAAVLSQKVASAGVPTSVVSSTIKAASLFAAGQAAPGAISVKVAALTEGVLKTMLLTKLKIASAVLLVMAVAIAGVGASGVLRQTQPAEPPKTQKTTNTPDSKQQAEGVKDNDKRQKEAASPESSRTTDAPKKDKAKLQGSWKGTSFEYLLPPVRNFGPPGFGKAQKDEVTKAKWTITDDKIVIRFQQVVVADNGGGEVVTSSKAETREMRYKVDFTKTPNEIDLTPCSFPYTQILKGTSEGIVELNGDTLKIAYGVPGMRRPAAFKAEGNDCFFQFVLKREPATKKEDEQKKGGNSEKK